MELSTYLNFNGNCEAAFKFYEKALGGKIQFMLKCGDSPMAEQTPANWRDKVMHSRIELAGKVLMGSDSPPDHYAGNKGFSISLSFDKPEDAERVFKALAAGAIIGMPLQETFWARKFGTLTDQFGIPWMINCEKPE
ncbi:MAG TPA: glyoxalase/bleomycin resistance/extradiol dioxygenase family protein [Candidatus Binataceae bacterium]|nr:glyoxalase/bleomycin resistance/extradiol dioxygenase family protein [Candidatus Binataceae bacterium]